MKPIFLLLALSAFPLISQETNEGAVRTIINTFAQLRNAHDGDAVAALYSEDGEWLQKGGTAAARGKIALAKLWSEVKGQVDRTILSVEFPGQNIAVVKVATQYGPPSGLHSEVFVLVTEDTNLSKNWKIRVHQTLD